MGAAGDGHAFQVDRLRVEVLPDRRRMGEAAAGAVARRMRALAAERPTLSMVFAAAPSQEEFLAALLAEPDLPWRRVVAFHLDEYLGLPAEAPQRFGNWLRARLFSRAPFAQVHYLDGDAADAEAECRRYAALLAAHPLDIACVGIGENGHLAFNDPPVADFADPRSVKRVALDAACRLQQVHDGAFPDVASVPPTALTLTIPAILAAASVVAVVPGAAKAEAVRAALRGPVSTSCPASVLRRHPDARLYLDAAAAALL